MLLSKLLNLVAIQFEMFTNPIQSNILFPCFSTLFMFQKVCRLFAYALALWNSCLQGAPLCRYLVFCPLFSSSKCQARNMQTNYRMKSHKNKCLTNGLIFKLNGRWMDKTPRKLQAAMAMCRFQYNLTYHVSRRRFHACVNDPGEAIAARMFYFERKANRKLNSCRLDTFPPFFPPPSTGFPSPSLN